MTTTALLIYHAAQFFLGFGVGVFALLLGEERGWSTFRSLGTAIVITIVLSHLADFVFWY